MSHRVRPTDEFLTPDFNFRVSADGNLETDDHLLVESEDMSAFIAWLQSAYNTTVPGND